MTGDDKKRERIENCPLYGMQRNRYNVVKMAVISNTAVFGITASNGSGVIEWSQFSARKISHRFMAGVRS